jgi:RNA polymerase sigma factor (sigma-70 family)
MTALAEIAFPEEAEPASGHPARSRAAIAQAAWEERPHLLRIARNRALSEADAQDVVSEAMARALEASDSLDRARVGAWLTAVTVNLCADLGRDRRRLHKRIRFAVQHGTPPPSIESVVVDRVSAATVVPLLSRLPAEQWRALALRADGHAVAEIASRLDVSEKAAESLLSRARTAARAIVSAASAVVALVLLVVRRTRPTAVAASSAAFTLALAAPFLAPSYDHGHANVLRSVPSVLSSTTARAGLGRLPAMRFVLARTHGRFAHAESMSRAHRPGHTFRRPLVVNAGPVTVRNDGSNMQRPNENLLQSLQRCITDGVEVSAEYVGCKHARSVRPPTSQQVPRRIPSTTP